MRLILILTISSFLSLSHCEGIKSAYETTSVVHFGNMILDRGGPDGIITCVSGCVAPQHDYDITYDLMKIKTQKEKLECSNAVYDTKFMDKSVSRQGRRITGRVRAHSTYYGSQNSCEEVDDAERCPASYMYHAFIRSGCETRQVGVNGTKTENVWITHSWSKLLDVMNK